MTSFRQNGVAIRIYICIYMQIALQVMSGVLCVNICVYLVSTFVLRQLLNSNAMMILSVLVSPGQKTPGVLLVSN